MFGNNSFWWLGLLVFLLFIGINVLIFFLRKNPRLSYAIAYTVAAFLLVYKIGEYITYQAIGDHMRFPVEFSALGYFLVGITVAFRLHKADVFPVFAGLLAGMFYSISFWVSPDSFVYSRDSIFLLVMAIVNHHLLYMTSMLMLVNVRKFKISSIWQLYLGTGILVGYSWLIYLFTPYKDFFGKPMIIKICDGEIMAFLFGGASPSGGALAAYYVVVVILLGLLGVGFFALNNACAKKRARKGLPENYFPEKISTVFKNR